MKLRKAGAFFIHSVNVKYLLCTRHCTTRNSVDIRE